MKNILSSLFGNYSKRELKRIQPTVDAVLDLEDKYMDMSDHELQQQTQVLKERLADGETTDDILPHGDIAKKAESFGLYTQVIDGHDVQAIYDAIQNAYAKKGVPSCIVLNTSKGKGATFAEPKHDHSSQPSEEQWAEAIAASEKALEAIKNA